MASVPPATVDEWIAQSPTLLLSRTQASVHEQLLATARSSSKAKASSPRHRRNSSGNQKRHRSNDNGDDGDDTHVIRSAPMLGDGGASAAAQARRCAPSFALIANSITQHHAKPACAAAAAAHAPSSAAAAAAPASASTSTSSTSDPLPPRLSKKHARQLTHDLNAYRTSLSRQAGGVVEGLLPARALALVKLGEQFDRELEEEEKRAEAEVLAAQAAAAPGSAVTPLPQHASQLSTEEQLRLIAKSTTSGAVLPAFALSDADDAPLSSLHAHHPTLHPSLPALGSECVQHGWSFRQPSRAHAVDSFTTRWVRTLQAELGDLVSLCAMLRCSLTLTLPEASDANNARLEICEELLANLRSKEDWAIGSKGRLVSYSMQRAKLMAKVDKYPGALDYVHSVSEFDHFTRAILSVTMASLRNSYILLHALYQKNLDKLLLDPMGDQAFLSMI